jgi:hypothetical protein
MIVAAGAFDAGAQSTAEAPMILLRVIPVLVLGSLLSGFAGAAETTIKIENGLGFRTAGPAEHLAKFWEKCKDHRKMQGKVSDHLTAEQIDTIIMLEVHIAIAVDPRSPSLQDEVLRFMSEEHRFERGPLPDRFRHKQLMALFWTKKGAYGLITIFQDIAVVELNGMVGVAPLRDLP